MQEAVLISFYDSESPEAKPIGQAHAVRGYLEFKFFDKEDRSPVDGTIIPDIVHRIVYCLNQAASFTDKETAENVKFWSLHSDKKRIPLVVVSDARNFRANMCFLEDPK